MGGTTWRLERFILEQTNRLIDEQSKAMEEQSNKNDRAARFSIGLLLAGIAVLSLLLPAGWNGKDLTLSLVVVGFSLFFIQALLSSIGLLRLAVSSGTDTNLAIGPSPIRLLASLKEGRYRSEQELVRALLILGARQYKANDRSIRKMAHRRDTIVSLNILSIVWLLLAVVTYILEALKWF